MAYTPDLPMNAVASDTSFNRTAWANRIAEALGVTSAKVLADDLHIELHRDVVTVTATVRKIIPLKDAGPLIAEIVESQR